MKFNLVSVLLHCEYLMSFLIYTVWWIEKSSIDLFDWLTEWGLRGWTLKWNWCKYLSFCLFFQSFSSTAWDLSTWGLVMISLSIMRPKSDFPGSASQRATRLMPSSVTRRPPPIPHTRKMASCTSKTDSSVWLIIRSFPFYFGAFSCSSGVAKDGHLYPVPAIRFQTNTLVCLFLWNSEKRLQTLQQMCHLGR